MAKLEARQLNNDPMDKMWLVEEGGSIWLPQLAVIFDKKIDERIIVYAHIDGRFNVTSMTADEMKAKLFA